jgi:hypothetical protein
MRTTPNRAETERAEQREREREREAAIARSVFPSIKEEKKRNMFIHKRDN